MKADIWELDTEMIAISICDNMINTCISLFDIWIKNNVLEYSSNSNLVKSLILDLYGLYVLNCISGAAILSINISDTFITTMNPQREK